MHVYLLYVCIYLVAEVDLGIKGRFHISLFNHIIFCSCLKQILRFPPAFLLVISPFTGFIFARDPVPVVVVDYCQSLPII
jgi:hypothetical protein